MGRNFYEAKLLSRNINVTFEICLRLQWIHEMTINLFMKLGKITHGNFQISIKKIL